MGSIRPHVAYESADITQTKREIMDKAAHLFAQKGYGSVGVSEISDMVGFGKGALYYHIRSKEDLLYSIMTDYMVRLVAAAHRILEQHAHTSDRVERLSESFLETMFANKAAMTVCFREVHSLGAGRRDDVLKLHSDYQQIWERTFEDGASAGESRLVNKIETKALLGMYFYSFLWVRTDGSAGSDAIARGFARIVLNAVAIDRA
ncbi:MAG: TetR/AcrR family transcriptional regulator [Pseudomonadota bacterium]